MTKKRAAMTRTPVLLSDVGALALSQILYSYKESVAAELFHADPDTHAFVLLDDEAKTANGLMEILEDAFPFLGEIDPENPKG